MKKKRRTSGALTREERLEFLDRQDRFMWGFFLVLASAIGLVLLLVGFWFSRRVYKYSYKECKLISGTEVFSLYFNQPVWVCPGVPTAYYAPPCFPLEPGADVKTNQVVCAPLWRRFAVGEKSRFPGDSSDWRRKVRQMGFCTVQMPLGENEYCGPASSKGPLRINGATVLVFGVLGALLYSVGKRIYQGVAGLVSRAWPLITQDTMSPEQAPGEA